MKRSLAGFLLIGLVIISLLFTFRLADKVAAGEIVMGSGEASAFGNMVSSIAFKLPVWAYVVVFVALVLGVRFAMLRYYKVMYKSSREKHQARESYIGIRHYTDIDREFSNDMFADFVGRLQEELAACAATGDFSPVADRVTEDLMEKLPGLTNELQAEMTRLKLDGFRQSDDKDIIATLINFSRPRAARQLEYEWLFERGQDEHEAVWRLCAITSMD